MCIKPNNLRSSRTLASLLSDPRRQISLRRRKLPPARTKSQHTVWARPLLKLLSEVLLNLKAKGSHSTSSDHEREDNSVEDTARIVTTNSTYSVAVGAEAIKADRITLKRATLISTEAGDAPAKIAQGKASDTKEV